MVRVSVPRAPASPSALKVDTARAPTRAAPKASAPEHPATRSAQAHPEVVGTPSASAASAAQAEKSTPRQSTVGGTGMPRFRVDTQLEGKRFEPTADVAALLARYEPGGIKGLGRPQERVLQTVATLDTFLQAHAGNVDKLVDQMIMQDLRKPLFALEAQLRLYSDRGGKALKKDLGNIKALEDALGAWGLRRDLLEAVDGRDVPAEVLALMHQDAAQARDAVKDVVASGWLPDAGKRNQVPVLNRMVDNLEATDFKSYEKDKKYLRKQVAGHIDDMLHTRLDLDDMQGGIHELRRQARWIPLFMLSSGGVMQLSEERNPVASLRPLLQSSEAQSPFAKMPQPDRERDPIMVSKSLYLANSRFVSQLGAVKDRGEMPEYVGEVYVKAGLAADLHQGVAMARTMMGRTDTDESIRTEARALWESYDASGALRALKKEFAD